MAQNLVSATISAEDVEKVIQNLSEIKSVLQFLTTLQSDDIQGLFKVGNNYQPFIEQACQAAKSHPEILPGVFDKDEFIRDCDLVKALRPIAAQIKELNDSLQNTFFAANSDAMVGALEVYSAVKQNRDKVPGLNVVADDMAVFFKKSTKKVSAN
ncbi:hypothetical protein [Parabacteroides sp. FAFU027]|uniref:hypothetical protein n=1 Tax=Parabacteroides sp. FAFU027 TaxID=2922715 RepID=UPI001FAEE806|nr:hypothetical protein [Parabacteroides sp. FAFU027]